MNVFSSALSLVIHKEGYVSDEDIADLLLRYREKKGIFIEKDVYDSAVKAALEHYHKKETNLLVCTGKSCLEKSFLHPSRKSLDKLEQMLGCAVETTGCQYRCEAAPIVSLKTECGLTAFENCSDESNWNQALNKISELLKKAPASKTESESSKKVLCL